MKGMEQTSASLQREKSRNTDTTKQQGYCYEYIDTGKVEGLPVQDSRYYINKEDTCASLEQTRTTHCIAENVASSLFCTLFPQLREGNRKFKDACHQLKELAENGDTFGQYYYAEYLWNGKFFEQNRDLALIYFDNVREEIKTAARQGDAFAQCCYAFYLLNGCGIDKSLRRAAKYYKRSADQGYGLAQYNYAMCLKDGIGITANAELSAHYSKLSADQGCEYGQVSYGLCLQNGLGTRKDDTMAAHYYKLAADQGYAVGQRMYGICLFDGIGVAVDREKAVEYFICAAEQDDAIAACHIVGCCYDRNMNMDGYGTQAY